MVQLHHAIRRRLLDTGDIFAEMVADPVTRPKPVKLNPSRCFPLYFEKQTYRRSPEEQSPRAAAAEVHRAACEPRETRATLGSSGGRSLRNVNRAERILRLCNKFRVAVYKEVIHIT